MSWDELYLDKPWSAKPNPPESFTCGELVRYVYRNHLGISSAAIVANPDVLRQCVAGCGDLSPYGDFRPVKDRRDFDVVQLVRGSRPDHVGLWCAEARTVVHCVRGLGVQSQTPFELRAAWGWHTLIFNRHAEVVHG